jgi:5,10-methylenetetrahydromethanopterin reductase
LADELGYYACYSADEIYHKDAWLLLSAVASRTERIRLGPCVSPIYVRDPTYVAQLAATLDELSDGRAEVVPDLREQIRLVGEQVLPELD